MILKCHATFDKVFARRSNILQTQIGILQNLNVHSLRIYWESLFWQNTWNITNGLLETHNNLGRTEKVFINQAWITVCCIISWSHQDWRLSSQFGLISLNMFNFIYTFEKMINGFSFQCTVNTVNLIIMEATYYLHCLISWFFCIICDCKSVEMCFQLIFFYL